MKYIGYYVLCMITGGLIGYYTGSIKAVLIIHLSIVSTITYYLLILGK